MPKQTRLDQIIEEKLKRLDEEVYPVNKDGSLAMVPYHNLRTLIQKFVREYMRELVEEVWKDLEIKQRLMIIKTKEDQIYFDGFNHCNKLYKQKFKELTEVQNGK